MKKAEFLAQLRNRLFQLPPSDVEKTLEYYSEMIDDYIESGYSPEAAVAKMGNVDDIAAQILTGARTPVYVAPVAKKQRKSGLAIVLLILGFPLWFPLLMVAFSVLLTLAIVVGVFAIVLPWSLAISFGASAIGLLIATVAILVGEGLAAAAFALGAALVLTALCIFCVWVGIHLAKLGAKGIGAMFSGSFKLLFGRR
jgi:uncharacterized membrane protein